MVDGIRPASAHFGNANGGDVDRRKALKESLVSAGIPEQNITDDVLDQLIVIDEDKISDLTVRTVIHDNRLSQPSHTDDIQARIKLAKQTGVVAEVSLSEASSASRTLPGVESRAAFIARTTRRFDSADWFLDKVSELQTNFMIRNQTQRNKMKEGEVLTWIDRELVRTGISPDFAAEDIFPNPNSNVELHQLTDLSHRINEAILIPNNKIMVASLYTGQVLVRDVLEIGEVTTKSGIVVPKYVYEHDNALGGNFAIAYMNYVAISTHADELAELYYNLARQSDVTDDDYMKSAQQVYRVIFDGLTLDEAKERFKAAHLCEEMAHSDAFRFVSSIEKRRVNRLRPKEDELMARAITHTEQKDNSDRPMHLHAAIDLVDAGKRKQFASGVFETEAKLKAVLDSDDPAIILLPTFRSQAHATYDSSTQILTALLSRGVLETPVKDPVMLRDQWFLKTLEHGRNASRDAIHQASQLPYELQFLTTVDRDVKSPNWRRFVL